MRQPAFRFTHVISHLTNKTCGRTGARKNSAWSSWRRSRRSHYTRLAARSRCISRWSPESEGVLERRLSAIEELEIKLAELDAEFNASGSTMRQSVWSELRTELVAQLDGAARAARVAEASNPTQRPQQTRKPAPPDRDGSKTPVMWKHFTEVLDELAARTRQHVAERTKPLEDRITYLEEQEP